MHTVDQSARQNQLDHIKASLNFLHPAMNEDYVVELTVKGCEGYSSLWKGLSRGGMTTGWFSSADRLAALAVDLDQGWLNKGGYRMEPENLYVTMNPVNPALLSRSYNVVSPGIKRCTDLDVTQYHNIYLDIDANRPADTSASQLEKDAAKIVAEQVQDYLTHQLAWPEPMFADSGNGYHLVYKAWFEAIPENTALLNTFFTLMHESFCASPIFVGDKQIDIKVDSTVFNPSRIIKLHGTTARKGMPTPNRPQRQSYVISLPPLGQPVVSQLILEQTVAILAQNLGKEEEVKPVTQPDIGKTEKYGRRPDVSEMFTCIEEVTPIMQGGQLDVQMYLNDHGYKVSEVKHGENGRPTMYVLPTCLFDPSHSGNEAAIGKHMDGKLFYQCFHDSCSSDPERSWPAARQIISGDDGLGKWMSGGSFGVSFPDIDKEGKPYATYDNFRALLKGYGITLWYNQMKRRVEAILPGDLWAYDDKKMLLTRALIVVKCRKHGVGTGDLDHWVHLEAAANSRHPVKDWVQSIPWDGVDRLKDLADTVKVKPGQEYLWELYLRKWLIQGIAALYHPHFSGKGVLTFTGLQNVGKTSWFRRLTECIPDSFVEGASLDPTQKDSVINVIGSFIAELGELDATFRKADIARIKAFLSNTTDKLRVPYAKDPESLKRQTIFAATVNDPHFLVDSTGNSRWWVVEVGYINFNHTINMQQVWAQALMLYVQGEQWHLTMDENDKQSEHNKQYEVKEPIMEKIRECFKFDTPRNTWTNAMTATQILELCGWRRPNRSDTTKAGNILIGLVGRAERHAVKGHRGAFYMMPAERLPFEDHKTEIQQGSDNLIPFKKEM